MPLFYSLFSTVLKEDERDIPAWIEDLPLPKEPYASQKAQEATGVLSTFQALSYAMAYGSSRRDLSMPSPWQDRMDRPEIMFVTISGFGTFLGLTKGLQLAIGHPPEMRQQGWSSGRMFAAAMFSSTLKYAVTFSLISMGILTGDRMFMDWRRRIARRQGVEIGQTQDVSRTPMAYGMAGAMTLSMFTFMDVYRPAPILPNLLRFGIPGYICGYIVGVAKCSLQRAAARDTLDTAAVARFREAVLKG